MNATTTTQTTTTSTVIITWAIDSAATVLADRTARAIARSRATSAR